MTAGFTGQPENALAPPECVTLRGQSDTTRRMRYLIALFGLALILPHPALAQAYDWRPVNQQTSQMLRAGQYDAALPLIKAGLAGCPNAVTPREAALCTAIFSENLADLREHQGDLVAAEAGFRELLRSRSSVLPTADKLVGQANYLLALFFERHGRREEAIASLRAAEDVARGGGPDRHAELAVLVTRHAMLLVALGKPLEALPLYQEAYAIARDTGDPGSRDALAALSNLFTGQVAAGQRDTAVEAVSAELASPDVGQFDPTQRALLAGKLALETSDAARSRAALAFAEAALPDLGNGLVTDPDASFTLLRGAARLNAALGDANRGVDQARRARQIAAATWGPASYAVTSALRTEADADGARHDFAAAVARLSEAAGILSGPQFGLTRVQIEVERGQMQSRADLAADAVAGHQAMLGSPILTDADPATRAAMLALLGEDLVRLDVFDAGSKACAEAATLAANQPGLLKDYVVKALLCSGNAAVALGRADEALDDASKAKAALWANVSAPDEPNRVSQFAVADLRARAFRDSGRDNEALPAYRDALELAKKSGDTGLAGAAWAQIAFVQRQLGLNKDADDSAAAGLAVLGREGQKRTRANLLNARALAAAAAGRSADAVPLFESSLALRRSEDITEPLAIAAGERDLAEVLSSLGRNAEAGRHMDAAIDGFRALGASRRQFLAAALDRRVSIATAADDPKRAESALRELIPLQDPASDDAAGARIILAGLLDNQGFRNEAATLRAESLSIETAAHGANSAGAIRVRLATLASLRDAGRLAEAAAAGRTCADQAAALHDMLLACLLAQGETALESGNNRAAATFSARAVVEAETHWSQDSATLLQALQLQARSAGALGDADGVIRLYDRIHVLSPARGSGRGWTDFGEGRLLVQAGETSIGQAMLRLALGQGTRLHDTGLAVAAAGTLAEPLVDTGRGREAILLWESVLPLLSEDAPVHRVTVLEGLGTAAGSIGQQADAARFFAEAVSLGGTEMGAGTPAYSRLVVAWSEALTRSGQAAEAEDALRLLSPHMSPAAERQQTIGMLRLASMANDSVAAIHLSRSLVAQARTLFGPGSAGEGFARLDLIEALIGAGKHVDDADLDDAVQVVEAQDPSWQSVYRATRLRGLQAAHTGRLEDASASFMQAELLVAAHEGVGSLPAAMERSNRASVQLLAGHPDEADRLFRQALEMAAPDGQWRNTVWARIATDAATAAERVGDIERGSRLRRDADGLLPPVAVRATIRWL
jgi:tetratricopeptide (TPR) repeat protein